MFGHNRDQMMAKRRREIACQHFRDRRWGCPKKIIVYFEQHKKKNNGFLGRVTHFALTCLGHSIRLRQLEGEYL